MTSPSNLTDKRALVDPPAFTAREAVRNAVATSEEAR